MYVAGVSRRCSCWTVASWISKYTCWIFEVLEFLLQQVSYLNSLKRTFAKRGPQSKTLVPTGLGGLPSIWMDTGGKIKCLSLLIWQRRSKTTIERLVVLNIYLNCTTKIKWRPKKIVRCPTGLGTLSPHLRRPTVTIVGLREGFWHSNLEDERRKYRQ